MLLAFGTVVTVSLGMVLLSLVRLDPLLDKLSAASSGIAGMHQGLLDQQTGLRGYLLTRDRQFLKPYTDGQRAYVEGATKAAGAVEHDITLRNQLRAANESAEVWHQTWATDALTLDRVATASSVEMTKFQRGGKTLFDAYRSEHTRLSALVDARITQTRRDQRRLFVAGMVAQGVTWLALLVAAVRRRRRIDVVLVAPIAELAATVERFEQGDLATHAEINGVVELQDLGRGLARLGDALGVEQRAADGRERAAMQRAQRNRQLLDNAREFASDLDLGHLTGSVAQSMERLAGAAATAIWLTSESDVSVLERPFTTVSAPSCQPATIGVGAVGLAAQFARPTWGVCEATGRPVLALPMVSAGRCLGVVELRSGPDGIDPELMDPLEALATHAATAIAAARLHEQVEHLSRHDGLTGLLNRRSFDSDLAAEAAICGRTGLALSVAMVDVDHFKNFNDTFGHPAGDALLRGLCAELRASIRSTDSAYRFGGEEFVLLLRGTNAADARPMVEELRRKIAQTFMETSTTASFGMADTVGAGTDPEVLLNAADRALYAAKHGGRNQVALSADHPVTAASA